MKITISVALGEETQAAELIDSISGLLPHVRVKKSTSHPPFTHIFLTTPQPKNTDRTKGND